MKKLLCLILFSISVFLYAFDRGTLDDHMKIARLSSFRLMGEIDLRTENDVSAPVKYRTLNHEGGMKVTVLEIGDYCELNGKRGLWLWVRLTSPMWVDSGEWIEKYQKFLIFLPDEMPVLDFEE
jgi:hypothetical protein